jgi:hypothetical protein
MEVEKKTRNRIAADINNTSIAAYRKFIKETGRSDISYETFSTIPVAMNELMFEKVKKGNYSVKIPKVGMLKLLKVTSRGAAYSKIDWGRYNAQNIWAPYRNTHTDGFIYKLHLYFYEKKNPVLSFFKFRPAQKHRRHLAQLIKNNEVNK